MRIEVLNLARRRIVAHFKKYPNASISAMFRNLRQSPSFSLIGDYPLLSFILTTVGEIGILVKRNAVKRTMCCSAELKSQRLLLHQLLCEQLTAFNENKVSKNVSLSLKGSIACLKGKIR